MVGQERPQPLVAQGQMLGRLRVQGLVFQGTCLDHDVASVMALRPVECPAFRAKGWRDLALRRALATALAHGREQLLRFPRLATGISRPQQLHFLEL